jgi:3-hydroxybutyryl-CoA dehydratase
MSLEPKAAFQTGEEIPSVRKKITQKKINLFADATGDTNPIHVDPEFAKKTFLGGTIAHGLMSLAYLLEMLRGFLGQRLFSGGEIEVNLILPTRPGDTIQARGRITEVTEDESGAEVGLAIWCENQKGEKTIAGFARGFKEK